MQALERPVHRPWRTIMRHASMVLLFLLLTSASTVSAQDAPSHTALPSIELPAELARVLRDYARACAAGDATALAELFTEDGFVPTADGWVRGKAEIRRVYEGSSGALQLRAHAYETAGSLGYIVGAYRYADLPDGIDAGKVRPRAPAGCVRQMAH